MVEAGFCGDTRHDQDGIVQVWCMVLYLVVVAEDGNGESWPGLDVKAAWEERRRGWRGSVKCEVVSQSTYMYIIFIINRRKEVI